MANTYNKKVSYKTKKGKKVTVDSRGDSSVMTASQKYKLEKMRIKQGNPAERQKTLRTTAVAGAASEAMQAQAAQRAQADKYGLGVLSDPMDNGSDQGQEKAVTDGYTPGNTGPKW